MVHNKQALLLARVCAPVSMCLCISVCVCEVGKSCSTLIKVERSRIEAKPKTPYLCVCSDVQWVKGATRGGGGSKNLEASKGLQAFSAKC